MQSVNRAAVIVKPKEPFVDWLNSLPDDGREYTLEMISIENSTFLVPEYDIPEEALEYVRKNHDFIFEWELWGWATDEELWPQKRNWKMFKEWFDIEINSEVFDLVNGRIEKEEL